MDIGIPELLIILVIVAMLFGVGKLPELFGAIGKGVREFRNQIQDSANNPSPTSETGRASEAPSDKS